MAENVEEKVVFTGDASQLTQTFDELVNAITKTREELKQYKDDKEKSAQLTEQLAQQEAKLVELMAKNNNVIDASKVSYRQLNDILKDLNKTYKETSDSAQRMSIAPAAKAINTELKTMDANIGNYQRNVGNYANSVEKAMSSVKMNATQVLRELPSLKYGVEMFFLAISNNLPMLIESLGRLKEARAAEKAASAEQIAQDAAELKSKQGVAGASAALGTAKGAAAQASIIEKNAEIELTKAEVEENQQTLIGVENDLKAIKASKDKTIADIAQAKAVMALADEEKSRAAAIRDIEGMQAASLKEKDAYGVLKEAEEGLKEIEVKEAATREALAVATDKLTDSQKRLNAAMAEGAAAGGTGKAVAAASKGFLSLANVMVLVVTVLALFSRQILDAVENLFTMQKRTDRSNQVLKDFANALDPEQMEKYNSETKKSTSSLMEMQKVLLNTATASKLFFKEQLELNKAMMEGAKSVAKEYVEIRLLDAIVRDAAKSQEDQNKAAEKLVELLDKAAVSTSDVKGQTTAYTTAIDTLVDSLYNQAKAQGVVQLLQTKYAETVLKAQGELINAQLAQQQNKLQGFVQWAELYFQRWLRGFAFIPTVSKEDFLDKKVKKWEKQLEIARTEFELFLKKAVKMFNFDDLFKDDDKGGNKKDNWFSRWEMRINELMAKIGMLAEKNNEVNLADTWKYSEQGMTYFMNKFDEYADHYRKTNKDLKDEDNKDLREVEVQRKKYLEEYYKYHNELSKKYLSAIQTEKDKELSDLLDWYKKEVAIYQQMGEDITNLDNEYEKRREAILDKYIDKYKNVDMVRQAIDERYNEYYNAMMDYELKQLDEQMDKEIKEYERKGIETTNLEEHYALERLKIVSKYAKEETQARIAEYQKQEDAASRRNAVETSRSERKADSKFEKVLSYAGGTSVTPRSEANAQIAGLEEEKRIYVESANLQIAEMQRVLDSGKLIGEQRLEMEKAIADAKNELELGTLEYQEQIEKAKLDRTKATVAQVLEITQQSSQGLGGMFDDIYSAIETTYKMQVKEGKMTEKEAEKELEKYRGVKAAAAAMDALSSAVGAYNSMASIPYVGPALGAAAAAAALAAGFANVKLILATTKDNAGVGAADTYSPNLSEFTPQFVSNATGRDDTDYLVNALEEKPIKAYVVESEATAAQEIANKRETETTW